jgi:hypothetical protein
MNTQSMTQQEIRTTGIQVLGRQLGVIGMIRFLQANETGHGDYTKERERLLGSPSIDQVVGEILAKQSRQQG